MIDDLSDPAFLADPHPVYARWRQEGPVRKVLLTTGAEGWLITRYDDVRQVLADPTVSKRIHFQTGGSIPSGMGSALTEHMLGVDPPDHTRLRRLVSAAFTPRRIQELRPRVEKIAADLLDAMAGQNIDGRDEVELVDAFAFPLPIRVICELLGVPSEDQDRFRAWSTIIVSGAARRAEAPGAFRELIVYLRELIELRRANPGDDLVSGLIEVRDREDRLTEDELTSMMFLLLIAGHETTVNLISNGVFLLLGDRERWERLRNDRDLLPAAIEEFLRYEGPVATASSRITTAPVEVGGVTIPAGERVLVALTSANRDGGRFEDADELRLDRDQNAHLGFGHGIHYCLGAPLARMEARIAFSGLMDRFPDMRLVSASADWRPGVLIRGQATLPVRLGE